MEKPVSNIVPTDHEKSEWARMAQDCYSHDGEFNYYGHRYSSVAALRKGESMPIDYFDALQGGYRIWLIDGAKALPRVDGDWPNLRSLFPADRGVINKVKGVGPDSLR